MPIALIVGPLAALVGVVAIFFVLRRKSVDKRSMYSARRSAIEHKVRAARQRTLAPHGRSEKVEEPPAGAPAPTSTWAMPASAPQATYEASAFEPPPAAPPPAVKGRQDAPSQSPWDLGAPAAPSQFAPPEAPPEAPPAPTFTPPSSEPVWTPAPAPAEPAMPVEPDKPAAAAPAAWSVVSEAKESAETSAGQPKKKGRRDAADAPPGGWSLASGNAPGMESDEVIKAPGQLVAVAQYAILVVGLVMVLIGVLVMVANSHGT